MVTGKVRGQWLNIQGESSDKRRPQGSVLGLVLLPNFVGDTDSGTEAPSASLPMTLS